VGVDAETQIGEVRAGIRDRSGGAHASHGRRVDGGHGFREGEDALGGRRARHVDVLLHRARDTVELAESTAVGDRTVRRVGRRQCLVGEEPHDRIEVTVDLVDANEVGLDDLAARRPTATDQSREFQGSHLPQFAHQPIMSYLWSRPRSAG
jgi:hypothetical protein